jgi:hypothetical protein
MNLSQLAPEEIVVQLDRVRKLQFRFRAWRYLEEKYGTQDGVLAAVSSLLPRKAGHKPQPILETLLYFLWAGLIQEDRALTIDQVEDMLDVAQVPEYIRQISRAITAAFPVPETEARPQKPSAENGIGAGLTGSAGPSAG